MAALVIADGAEAETRGLDGLDVPHMEVGAERIGEEEGRAVLAAFDLIMDADAVGRREISHQSLSVRARASANMTSTIASALPR